MRISDWSSDVCSSDLFMTHIDRRTQHFERTLDDLDCPIDSSTKAARIGKQNIHQGAAFADRLRTVSISMTRISSAAPQVMAASATLNAAQCQQIGRASCRERVCQYV